MPKPELRDHRKFLKMIRLLGNIPVSHAIGYLDCMWNRGYQTGSPFVGDAHDVESAAVYPGEPGTFAAAAFEAGFLDQDPDGNFIIHDLWEHAPSYAKKRIERRGFAPEGTNYSGERHGDESRTSRELSGNSGNRSFPNGNNRESTVPERESSGKENDEKVPDRDENGNFREDVVPDRETEPNQEPKPKTTKTKDGPAAAGGWEEFVQEFVECWNVQAKAIGWIPCVKVNSKRKGELRARWQEVFWRERWREAMEKAAPITGLRGLNERRWKANVDWFLRPGTVVKILEGSYDGWNGGPSQQAQLPPLRTRQPD